MKKFANELIFISQIKRDGLGVEIDFKKPNRNDFLELTRLSISEKTYIAYGFNTYVVKLKGNENS